MNKLFLLVFMLLSFTLNIGIAKADPVQDLYVELMPLQDRVDMPNEAYKSYQVHRSDSYKKFPAFSQMHIQNIVPFAGTKNITGNIFYVSIFPKKYSYDVSYENGKYVMKVRINLKNPKAGDVAYFTDLVQRAEKEWNDYRIGLDFMYEFKFSIEPDPKKAHYSVNILDSTRGPYDTNWGRDWDGPTVAHEVGHMMGLGDEYQTLSGKIDCLPHSKMCDQNSNLMLHHYYFILRRLIK